MARRPLLPERLTIVFSLMGSLVTWAGATRLADAVLPASAAIAVGILMGIIALVGIPTALGRPTTAALLLGVVGGLVILVGFVAQLDDIGIGMALAIYLPASVVLAGMVWVAKRYLVPTQPVGDRG